MPSHPDRVRRHYFDEFGAELRRIEQAGAATFQRSRFFEIGDIVTFDAYPYGDGAPRFAKFRVTPEGTLQEI